MTKKTIFFLIFASWLAIIIGFIGYKQYTVSTGEKILLKTMPVDPRDILRGDYVILNYEISRLNMDQIPHNDNNFSVDRPFFLVLEKGEKYWHPVELKKVKPKGDNIFIKGIVKSIYSNRMTAEYGIESYFIPEGRGIEIESAIRGQDSNVDVEIYVDKYGNSVISKIYVNDVPFEPKQNPGN